MANTNVVNGLRPVQNLDGSPWNGKTRKFYKAAGTTVTNDYFPGDPVILSGSGDAKGIPGVSIATAGANNQICGVIVSIVESQDHLDRTWIDGADAGYVNVCCDPNTVFEAQADDALTYTDIGNNAPLVKTQAGSRTTGASGFEVDATTSTTANDQLKIIGFVQREDNTINSENNKVLVIINNHQFKGYTGNAGV